MKRLILIRHGESESNVDKLILQTKPNHLIELTEKGRQQALDVGKTLLDPEYWGSGDHLIVSPHIRTIQTAKLIQQTISPCSYKEELRIREVDVGNLLTDDDLARIRRERPIVGRFHYRFPNGESLADVYLRLKQWLAEKPFDDYPDESNIIIVTHAATMNVFQMIWENLPVSQFNDLPKPQNSGMIVYEIEK
jgi:broad specificity phosphatase PhoE